MSEFLLWVTLLPSLICPSFKLNIEQDKLRKALSIKQETEWTTYDFDPFC